MSHRGEVAPSAVRQLRTLDPAARRRIQAAIELLAERPRPSGAKRLVGGDGEWRVRTGDYCIVYEIHDEDQPRETAKVPHIAASRLPAATGGEPRPRRPVGRLRCRRDPSAGATA